MTCRCLPASWCGAFLRARGIPGIILGKCIDISIVFKFLQLRRQIVIQYYPILWMKNLRLREDLQPAQIRTAAVSGQGCGNEDPKTAITEQSLLPPDLTSHRVRPHLNLTWNNSECDHGSNMLTDSLNFLISSSFCGIV